MNLQQELKEKIRYFTDQAVKRKLDHANSTRFVAYRVKQWLEKFHPDEQVSWT